MLNAAWLFFAPEHTAFYILCKYIAIIRVNSLHISKYF
jgi:hypothetical protein